MIDPLMVAVGLIGNRELTDSVLSEVMAQLALLPMMKDANLVTVRKQLEAAIGVSMSTGEGLTDGENSPWVEEIKASTEWHYWDSYVKQLKAGGFPMTVIPTFDEDTDNILTECGNPKNQDPWRVQGLVMGDVQSGKTASYAGLICKAADTGYKIIVLLTGMIEDLRTQSQERLDENFVGRDSRHLLRGEIDSIPIGAGRFRQKRPNVLTSIDSDFLTGNHGALRGIPLVNINEPVLLVMKKNKSALENLISYLKAQRPPGAERLDLPLFLVDDEADNASVNSKKDSDPATINRLIRELLAKFSRATYVAYTATPFANIFINPDGNDLFPKNFVYSLEAPTSYIGASDIFSDEGAHAYQLQDIVDAADVFPEKHKKTLIVQAIPESLHIAINIFLLSCAIRDLRGEPLKHRSMLVNVTRFTEVQRELATLIKTELYSIVEEIKQYLADDDLWARHQPLVALHQLYLEHYRNSGISWDQLRKVLYESIASIKVVTVNQRTDRSDRLNYKAYKNLEKGRRVIAVGGLTLSRGLTLEGLCVSYFYRNSKAYDTLLQMGRWFGYRPGYADLCRVWMAPEAQDWFAHIADVVTELRVDLRRMHVNLQPPSQFGIRVKSHPETLLVTAANKMRNSMEVKVSLSFSGSGIETAYLPNSEATSKFNASVTTSFLKSLGPAESEGSRYFWRAEAGQVAQFLQQLEISPMNMTFLADHKTGEKPLIAFIRNNDIDALKNWDVCLAQGNGMPAGAIEFFGPGNEVVTPRTRYRQFEKPNHASAPYLTVNKHRVGEISDEKVMLSLDLIRQAEEQWRLANKKNIDKTVPGPAYRAVRNRPLLTIHPIEPSAPKDPTAKRAQRILSPSKIEPKLLIGLSLSFPRFDDESDKPTVYSLNKIYMQQLGLVGEEDGDDDDQD